MKNTMEYRGYIGSAEFSEADGLFYGKVLGIDALVDYDTENAKEMANVFHEAVDEYLEFCKEQGIVPEKSYKGSFNVRVKPELHKKLALKALKENISLNQAAEHAIKQYVSA